LRDLQAEYTAKNAVIVGISFDTREDNKAFAEKYQFPFPLLCDTTRSVGMAYGAAKDAKSGTAKRIGVIIDPDGKVKHVDDQVTPKGYAERTLELL